MDVLVTIGIGGMGRAIARRVGAGRKVVLADFNVELLERLGEEMRADGFDCHTKQVDVASRDSVRALAEFAAGLGPVRMVAHTAGLSPNQATLDDVLKVDLVGVALVLEIFGKCVAERGAGVVISSSSSYMSFPFSPEDEHLIRSTAPEGLVDLPLFSAERLGNAGIAYAAAKRANRIQVQAAAGPWGERGARINSISPGIISTPMGRLELGSPTGAFMRAMIEYSATGRVGTPEDIAEAAGFLLGEQASFITGVDLLTDGGQVAAVATGRVPMPGR